METLLLILSAIFAICSGISEAIVEILLWRPASFIFLNQSNQQYLYPDISWKNKYKNGDKKEGEAFFLSTTLLVWLTDAYHLFRMLTKRFWDLAVICIVFLTPGKCIIISSVSSICSVIIIYFACIIIRMIVFQLFYSKIFIK